MADLDGDGDADNYAELCFHQYEGDGEDEVYSVILVEDARRRRFQTVIHQSYGEPDSQLVLPPFVKTNQSTLTVSNAQFEQVIALRGGRLVELARRLPDEKSSIYDWERLEHRERGSGGPPSSEAIVLVTRDGRTAARSSLVGRRGRWRGPSDASFTVSAVQPADGRIELRIEIADDVRVPATARTEAAAGAADHFDIRMGADPETSLRLARLADGQWFVVPLGESRADGVMVRGARSGLRLSLPTDHLDFHTPWFTSSSGWGSWDCGSDKDGGEDGNFRTLVIAYSDVNVPGGPVKAVVATAPSIPADGEGEDDEEKPPGLLVTLPHGDRWPESCGPLPPSR